jgi:hypothetical protein
MISSTAHVPTDRAGRYASQLCDHAGQLAHFRRGHGSRPGHAGAPRVARAKYSGSEGTIDFPRGRCTLRATTGSLILRAEADGEEELARIEAGVASRLQRIGRRDGLTVTWQRDTPGDGPTG